jgi:hypothetical protein
VHKKDLDNILKPVFDALKEIVFVDDKQIIKLSAEKTIDTRIRDVAIGIKKLTERENILICPYMWSSENDSWEIERQEKIDRGEDIYMDYY